MSGLSQQEIGTSKELTNWYNILANNTPGTSPAFFGVLPYIGKTATHEKTDYIKDLTKKAILFQSATHDDLENKPEGDWSKLIVTGPVTTLKYIVKGVDLPDITTRISAEKKDVARLRNETFVAYDLLRSLQEYINDCKEDYGSASPSKIMRKFFEWEWGIKGRSKRLELEDTFILPSDAEIPFNAILQEGSVIKRYGVPTNYLKILIPSPNDIQFSSAQTTTLLRINKRNPLDKLERVLGEHLAGLQPIYESISK